MDLFLYYFIATFLLWAFFIVMTVLIQKWKAKTMPLPLKVIAIVFAAFFLVVDAAYNIVFGTLIFTQWPRQFLFTTRLKYNLTQSGWRKKLAKVFCKYLLEPFDEGHCGRVYRELDK